MTDAEFNLRGESGSSWEGWIRRPHSLCSFALFSGKTQSGIMMGIRYLLSNLTLKFRLCKTQKRTGNSIRTSSHIMYSLFLGKRNTLWSLCLGASPGFVLPGETTFCQQLPPGEALSTSMFSGQLKSGKARNVVGERSKVLKLLPRRLIRQGFFRSSYCDLTTAGKWRAESVCKQGLEWKPSGTYFSQRENSLAVFEHRSSKELKGVIRPLVSSLQGAGRLPVIFWLTLVWNALSGSGQRIHAQSHRW